MQKYEDFEHKDDIMYCATTQFPELPFCGPHNKPYGVYGLSNNYKMRFDTNLDHDTYDIFCIT